MIIGDTELGDMWGGDDAEKDRCCRLRRGKTRGMYKKPKLDTLLEMRGEIEIEIKQK